MTRQRQIWMSLPGSLERCSKEELIWPRPDMRRDSCHLPIRRLTLTGPCARRMSRLRKYNKRSFTITLHVIQGRTAVRPYVFMKGYTLKNRDKIIRIYKRYELHVGLHLAVDRFKDIWEDMSYLK